jgi:dihydroorotate dehydrogenase
MFDQDISPELQALEFGKSFEVPVPDWSYQNVFQPLLFRLSAPAARDLTFRTIGRLARAPWGPKLIEFMGHMRPSESAGVTAFDLSFSSRVGLGAGLDVHVLGPRALAKFGFGWLEFGPVTLEANGNVDDVQRDRAGRAILSVNSSIGIEELLARLEHFPARSLIRLGFRSGSSAEDTTRERQELLARLEPFADAFTLSAPVDANGQLEWTPQEWLGHVRNLRSSKPLLVGVPISANLEHVPLIPGVAYLVQDGMPVNGTSRFAPENLEPSLRTVRELRSRFGADAVIFAGAGVHSPADAMRTISAGADFVGLTSGLVFSGPGLPKRINAAMNDAHCIPSDSGSSEQAFATFDPRAWPGWVWLTLLGLGMVFAGSLVGLVGAFRATLPYDERYLGWSRDQLAALNPRLLPFMTHDRVTLAGTMVSIGLLYAHLAFYGVRRGLHWAWNSIRVSAVLGFSSFFLFVLFGYFDWLHALASLLLLPFFVIGLRKPLPARQASPALDLENDRIWRVGLVGQFLFVVIGLGLMLAGITIAGYGAFTVFVPQDLNFMGISRAALEQANARLLPLVAHDRSGFGGALWSDGLAVLTSSLWGFERGARWVWRMLLLSGSVGFVSTLAVHFVVGYVDIAHLLPAYIGFVMFVFGLAFAHPYLHARAVSGQADRVQANHHQSLIDKSPNSNLI